MRVEVGQVDEERNENEKEVRGNQGGIAEGSEAN